ncbi:hypothetical protein [Burkholderia sp. Z1]|uniref:hypothetical protein n=1 Tax=Burkholderia sp. Z1 TaxID=2759039 RepID=UPI0018680791|nr:hypothetical protein [Burkholderia sp. Z1]
MRSHAWPPRATSITTIKAIEFPMKNRRIQSTDPDSGDLKKDIESVIRFIRALRRVIRHSPVFSTLRLKTLQRIAFDNSSD